MVFKLDHRVPWEVCQSRRDAPSISTSCVWCGQEPLPKLSQETLAEMVCTTRPRINFFMNKFRRLGFIEFNGGLKINNSLISIVLHD